MWQRLAGSSPKLYFFFLSTQLDYISQPPLQLEVAMWLSSGQWVWGEMMFATSGLSH